ncbi:type II secretion system minor pseudopilin GspK [Citrifermentans bremense]|uniref:type II secretion system minor pseudopilin GspK n=1 Tax=Citrifermentans bremense TaxID=60035 RepID=UPI0003FE86A7|nr:type II secretion system minor pseudopilin GspK [Citrifermentans bremense]
MRGEKGFALVITLIVTALLVALLVEFVNEVYVDTSHSHNFVASQQAGMLAESGVEAGKMLLYYSRRKTDGNYTSLLDLWAQPQSLDMGEGTVSISIEEESGKLNLSNATNDMGTLNTWTELTTQLFTELKISTEVMQPTDLTAALIDWVDLNDNGAAESNYYKTLTPPYSAKNKKLETVEELALIKGYTPSVIAKLKPCITVYGDDTELVSRININTATKEVLAALGLSKDLVERILDYRKTRGIKDEKELGSIPGVDKGFTSWDKITYVGNVYRIRVEGKVRESVAVAEAVVRITDNSAVVLYWREY